MTHLASIGFRIAQRLPARLLLLALCAPVAPALAATASPLAAAGQVVMVITEGWDANQGRLHTFVRQHGRWHDAGIAYPVAIGRNGSAWGAGLHPAQHDGPAKQEGDGRSPAGVFALDQAFGYAPTARTAMPYQPMQAGSYCMDVPDSPLYNTIVDAREVGADAVKGSSEPMRLDLHHDGDVRYRNGLVIAHNPARTPGAGSCIFAHLWRTPGEPTAGCTAMASADMDRLLAWLAPQRHPVFVLLPRAEYARLRDQWHLPPLPGTPR